jgi:hypothetical protein
VSFFTYTCPLLVCSEKRAAKIFRSLLPIVIGFAMGMGLGDALESIW